MKRTDDNLRTYTKALHNALEGIGTEVDTHQLKEVLSQYVSEEFAKLDTENTKKPEYSETIIVNDNTVPINASNDLEYHALGGGFALKCENKLFILPIFDRNGEDLHIPLLNKINIERFQTLDKDNNPATYKEYKILCAKLYEKGFVNSVNMLTQKGEMALEEYDQIKRDIKHPFMFASDGIIKDHDTGLPLKNQNNYKGNLIFISKDGQSNVMYTEIDPETKERSWNPAKVTNWELAVKENKTFAYDSELYNKPDVYKYYAGPLKGQNRENKDSWKLLKTVEEPRKEKHGDTFSFVIGPFKCKKDAEYYVENSLFNLPGYILPSKVATLRKEAETKIKQSTSREK